MLQVPGGDNVSEGTVSWTFVAPFEPGDRDKHYVVAFTGKIGDVSPKDVAADHGHDAVHGCQQGDRRGSQ